MVCPLDEDDEWLELDECELDEWLWLADPELPPDVRVELAECANEGAQSASAPATSVAAVQPYERSCVVMTVLPP
jgi:hypothetical protein